MVSEEELMNLVENRGWRDDVALTNIMKEVSSEVLWRRQAMTSIESNKNWRTLIIWVFCILTAAFVIFGSMALFRLSAVEEAKIVQETELQKLKIQYICTRRAGP